MDLESKTLLHRPSSLVAHSSWKQSEERTVLGNWQKANLLALRACRALYLQETTSVGSAAVAHLSKNNTKS